MHLITREALALYLDKLETNGVIAFNVSNRNLDFKPVLGALAKDAGLVGLVQLDSDVSDDERAAGKNVSEWVIMARSPSDVEAITATSHWQPLPFDPSFPVWTDDFSSILLALR